MSMSDVLESDPGERRTPNCVNDRVERFPLNYHRVTQNQYGEQKMRAYVNSGLAGAPGQDGICFYLDWAACLPCS